MGNYENLKQSITEVIRTNGNQEITGAVLQSTLLTIISTVGANATFAGIATPTTNPGTPDGPVFYLASESGTYTNFNAIELQDGLSVLMWNGSWSSQQIFGIDNGPTAGSDNLVKSEGVLQAFADIVSHLVKSGVTSYSNVGIGSIQGYYINNNGVWVSQTSQLVKYLEVHKGDFVKIIHGGNSLYSKYAIFSSIPQINDVPSDFIPNSNGTTEDYAIITQDSYIATSNIEGKVDVQVIASNDIISLISDLKQYLYVQDFTEVNPTVISNAYIKPIGDIVNNFPGYNVNYYAVSGGDKFYIKGQTTGFLTAISFYKSNNFVASNAVKLLYNQGGTTNIDEFITIPSGATYMAISQVQSTPTSNKIVVSTYQNEGVLYSSYFLEEIDKIYDLLFSYDETSLVVDEYKNGYYINTDGVVSGRGTFPGYRLVLYEVQSGKKYRLKGKDSGNICVAKSFTDSTLTTGVTNYLPHGENTEFDVNDIIQIVGSATILAVCEKTGTGYDGIQVYELSDERTINNIEDLQERVSALEDVEFVKKQVVCWGDSLTAGVGSQNTTYVAEVKAVLTAKGFLLPDASYNYVQTIAALLGTDNYQVVNCGVGGENINTIAAREGALPACIEANVTIPVLASEYGSISGLKSAFDLTENCAPLLQGHGNSVNPCYLEGIKCTLSYDSTNGYRIKRQSDGDRSVTVVNGTPIIMHGSSAYRNADISILWCWTNGGYSSNEELIQKLKLMVQHLNTERYIIIGIHHGNTSTLVSQENELLKNFGDKFFNWRKYVSSNAMYDFGITPTSDDLIDMQDGKIPRSFLTDSVHMNSGAYMILGWKLYERMIQLGYIS